MRLIMSLNFIPTIYFDYVKRQTVQLITINVACSAHFGIRDEIIKRNAKQSN